MKACLLSLSDEDKDHVGACLLEAHYGNENEEEK